MIPTNWSQVTLENFYPFARTLEETPKTDLEEFDLMVKRACFLSDMDVEDIMQLPEDEINKVNNLLRTPYPTKINKYIRHKGQLYRVILNPNAESAWRYKAIMNECRNEKGDNLHKILYLCCVPIKSMWNKKEVTIPAHEVEELMNGFKQLPYSIVNPIVVFFCNLSKSLTENILLYSEDQMKKMKTIVDKQIDSLKSMDG